MSDIHTYEPLWGSWYVESLLGEGSFGKVYKVRREEFGMTYFSAVKIITIPQNDSDLRQMRSEGMDDASARSYFHAFVTDIIQEVNLMSEFRGNSNIVSFEDHKVIERTDGIGWDILIRMELLTSLTGYAADNPLDVGEVVKLGVHMCRALELCARKDTIHRDIKPDNIFVSQYGEYKLGDFGIARQIERTSSGLSKKGTYTYMAPEVFRGDDYGASVDTYSLGIVLYRLLNRNRSPFLPPYPNTIAPRDRDEALQRRMRGEKIPPIPGAPPELNAIVLKACEYNRNDRFGTAEDMRRALEALDAAPQPTIDPQPDPLSATRTHMIFEPERTPTSIEYGKAETIFDTSAKTQTPQEVTPHPTATKSKKPLYITIASCAAALALIITVPKLSAPRPDEEIPVTAPVEAESSPTTTTPPPTATLTPTPTSTPNTQQSADYITIQGERYSTDDTHVSILYEPVNEDLEPLRYMTKVTSFSLRNTQITDISPLAGMTSLEELYLENNQISDLSPLAGLTNLRTLHLNGNQISDLSPLAGLTNLEWLHLEDNQISDISPLAELVSLNTRIDNRHLDKLWLNNNQISDLSPLAGLVGVNELYLDGNQISDLSPLTELYVWYLSLNDNQISDLNPLSEMRRIKVLCLNDNQVTEVGPLMELPELEVAWLGNNQISDIWTLAVLENLLGLYLNGNQITDISPLMGMMNLTVLDLTENPITDWSPVSHVGNVLGRP
jgi:Leucine-rich repeat (LRR) protein